MELTMGNLIPNWQRAAAFPATTGDNLEFVTGPKQCSIRNPGHFDQKRERDLVTRT